MQEATARRREWQGRLDNLVPFRKPGAISPVQTRQTQPPPPEGPVTDDKIDAMRMMVLLSPDGNVLSAKGADADDFAAVAAYATQLAKLIGDDLGLDGFRELGCEFKRGRCLIYFDESGNTVGVRPKPEVPMAKVREMLGFI